MPKPKLTLDFRTLRSWEEHEQGLYLGLAPALFSQVNIPNVLKLTGYSSLHGKHFGFFLSEVCLLVFAILFFCLDKDALST